MQMQLSSSVVGEEFLLYNMRKKHERKRVRENIATLLILHLFLGQRLRGLVGKFAFFKLNTCWLLLPCRCLI